MANSISPKEKERAYIRLGLRIMADFGATIAVPVVVFVYIGGRIDERYGSGPYGTIGAFFLAAIVSGTSIYKKAKMYGRLYDEVEPKKPQTPDV